MHESDFEIISRHLSYDENTGVFTWKVSTGNRARGDFAGSLSKTGYIMIKVLGRRYGAHRMAILLTEGVWPPHEVDHIDGNRTNNRRSNLRCATRMENAQNIHRSRGNTASGLLGVSFHSAAGKWESRIQADGRRVRLGFFASPDEAYARYLEAKRLFHPHSHMAKQMGRDDLVARLER